MLPRLPIAKAGKLLFGFIILISPVLKAQEKITLSQAIDSTIANNIQVKQAQFDALISDENIKQAKAGLCP